MPAEPLSAHELPVWRETLDIAIQEANAPMPYPAEARVHTYWAHEDVARLIATIDAQAREIEQLRTEIGVYATCVDRARKTLELTDDA